MAPDKNDSEESDKLERRLDRLWDDRQRVPGNSAEAGQRFGNYEIQRPVGAGAFGIVYLATDVTNNRPVALKVPRAEVLVDKEKLARFITETSLIDFLNHPNIVEFLATDTSGPVPWLATEWCDGSDLGSWLQRKRSGTPGSSEALDWKEVAIFVAQIADAVHHVHEQGIAHRDLKPTNIMLCSTADSDGRSLGEFTPKVADFGLSKLQDGNLANTKSSVILGTPFYMAPEQMDGSSKSESSSSSSATNSDIYSLGAILFELLAGRPPVDGNNYFEVMAKAKGSQRPRASRHRSGIPSDMDRICSICLRKNPQARYESAEALANDLRRSVAGESIVGSKYPLGKRYAFWHSRQPWMKVAGAFALFYCFVIGLWFIVTASGFLTFNDMAVGDALQMLPEAISLLLTSILLPAVIGWFCWSGKKWAAVIGFLLNLPKAVVYGSGMLGRPMMFNEYYENYSPYLTFSVHLFFFICSATQMVLYLFALMSRMRD